MKYILIILLLCSCTNHLMAQLRSAGTFCYNKENQVQNDTVCVFAIGTTKDYKNIVMYPNIFKELGKKYVFNRISDATGKYRVIIEFGAFQNKVFINDVKIDYCDNSEHRGEINAIIKSCTIKFEKNELWEEKRTVLSYTAFNLTPK